ncbi:MAG: formylglycine-generating enzyme family protein [Syntrophaceae bacterium]|nr:formylglycine-generating enzyme family protein [Syntrophaceae bacterium]
MARHVLTVFLSLIPVFLLWCYIPSGGVFSAEETSLTNAIGMVFVIIPAGSFKMGSPVGEPGRRDDEIRHKVTLTKPFYMQTTEVTNKQWKAVMTDCPSHFEYCGDNCPVEKVSWNDCQSFIQKLNALEGTNKYRLPTEAEWEYACRAGSETALYNGHLEILGRRNAPALGTVAWYAGNSCVDYSGGYVCAGWAEREKTCSRCGPHPVGLKEPNPWGLYDMHGNVYEWCQDWYGIYSNVAVSDSGEFGHGTVRVLRGGSWGSGASNCRSASRSGGTPDARFNGGGFRVARNF